MRWIVLLACFFSLHAQPYFCGDCFREYADHVYENAHDPFYPSEVRAGNVIYVQTHWLYHFYHFILPYIQEPFILVTHNSDDPVPGHYVHLLDDPRLIAWFSQNCNCSAYPKLHQLPIGISNSITWTKNLIDLETWRIKSSATEKTILLYLNFSDSTNRKERLYVRSLFKDKPYCFSVANRSFYDYLSDLAHAKFVLSPEGAGVDCFRTWEALLMGAIPIVKTSYLDPLFEHLPVLIVSEWTDLNLDLLEQKYVELKAKPMRIEPFLFNYWREQIEEERAKFFAFFGRPLL